jgi:O-phosphoseryl-tRNA(Cys) synthetase
LQEVAKVLEAADIEVNINKVNILNEKLAYEYRFVSSPTIRINGKDIQLEVKESLCESCGDLCGDDVDCRVWVYQGKEYTVPPKALIINAILKELYGGSDDTDQEQQEYVLPENLKRYFEAMRNKEGKCEIFSIN